MATLKNLTINDTGYLQMPSGTIAQRPASPSQGMIRYNTDFKENEYYNGTDWITGTGDNSIVRNGLVLWLDAGLSSSYSGSGTTWTDLSGNGRNGTLTNGPTYSSDNGGSLSFDGVDDYIECGNIGTIGNTYSIDCFFNSSSVVNYRNLYDMNYSTYSGVSGNVGPRFEQFSDGTANWVWSGNTSNNSIYTFTTAAALSANTWYHTVFTMNSGTVNTYVNGVIRDSNVSSGSGYVTTFGSVNLGRGFILAGNRYFSGRIPSFRLYNRVLSLSEVQQNYQALRGRFGI